MSHPAPVLPDDLHVLMEHQVWARPHDDGSATVGITQLGIQLSGEIYMARSKRVGTEMAQGDTMAVVELAKAIVAVKSPVSGSVVETNPALAERPELVHLDPYGEGWIARLQLSNWATDQQQLLHGEAALKALAEHARLHQDELVPATTPGLTPDPAP